MAKLTPEQAAAKAFRDCRLNTPEARKTASYLAKQHMLASGATQQEAADSMQSVNASLDQWFEQRSKNADFKPELSATVAAMVAPKVRQQPKPAE